MSLVVVIEEQSDVFVLFRLLNDRSVEQVVTGSVTNCGQQNFDVGIHISYIRKCIAWTIWKAGVSMISEVFLALYFPCLYLTAKRFWRWEVFSVHSASLKQLSVK